MVSNLYISNSSFKELTSIYFICTDFDLVNKDINLELSKLIESIISICLVKCYLNDDFRNILIKEFNLSDLNFSKLDIDTFLN